VPPDASTDDRDRLVCPTCKVTNTPTRQVIVITNLHRGIAKCTVCETVGLESAFKPWLWTWSLFE
jgi:hypothetical protein